MDVAAAAFILTSVIPVVALLLARVRNARRPLRAVGACVLIGLACYNAYLVAPAAGWRALITALVAVVGIGLALLGLFMSGVATLFRLREPADAR